MKWTTNRRGSRAVALTAAALSLALVTAACGSSSDSGSGGSGSSGKGNGNKTIFYIPKQLNNPYTDVELGGGTKAAGDIGWKATTVGPLDAGASAQVPFIQQATQKRAGVIAIAANDPDSVGPALQAARKAGTKIIAFDSDTNPKYRDLFISQVVAKDVGLIQIESISKLIGGKGEIAILSATATATNQNEWIKYIKEAIASDPKYKDIKLVTTVYGDDDADKSFKEAQGLLQSYPNLKGIISPTTVGIAATAKYLSTSKYKGQVQLTGLGLPNEMRSFVKDGTVSEFALWDPAQLGQVTTYAAQALAEGKITGKEGDTFTAGSLGERTVGADGIVIVGPPTTFTKDNIDQYDF